MATPKPTSLPKPTSHDEIVAYVHAYFKRYMNLLPGGKPGFAHGMKLFYHTMDTDRISVGDNTFTYRYQLSEHVPKFTTGLCLALMDELSSTACFSAALPGMPGLSLQMQTELVQPDLTRYQELDIISTVTKRGRSISHTRTEFVCPKSNEIVAYSSHLKFMTNGDKTLDDAMVNFDTYKTHVDNEIGDSLPPIYEEKPFFQGVMLPHFEFLEHGRATFQITLEHTNPFGALHGGCHAVVMEVAAERFAQKELQSLQVANEAMQIEYLKSARPGKVEVLCEKIGRVNHVEGGSTLRVRVFIKSGGRTCSEGKLRFRSSEQRQSKL